MTTFNRRYDGRGVGVERVKHYYEGNGCKGNHHLYNSIVKYGVENFKVEIIHIGKTREELNYFESFYERLYNTTNPKYGYNKKPCGDCLGKRWHNTDEWYLKQYCFKYKKRMKDIENFLSRRQRRGLYDGNECYNLFSADIIYNFKHYKGLLSIPYGEIKTYSIWKIYNSEWEYWIPNETHDMINNKMKEKEKTIVEKLNLMKQEYLKMCKTYNDIDLNILKDSYPMLYRYCMYKCEENNEEFTNESVLIVLEADTW